MIFLTIITKKILNPKILLAIYLLAIKHFIFEYIKEFVDYIQSFRIILISLKNPGITQTSVLSEYQVSLKFLEPYISPVFIKPTGIPDTLHIYL